MVVSRHQRVTVEYESSSLLWVYERDMVVLYYYKNVLDGYGGSSVSLGYSRGIWRFLTITGIYWMDMRVPHYY